VALVVGGCARHPQVVASHQITVYYCKSGTDALVPVHYPVSVSLTDAQVASFAVNQLLAGSPAIADEVVLFPPGTRASVSESGGTATVNLTGAIVQGYHGGAGAETALFKSLTFTLTDLPDVKNVQVLADGKNIAALPGGHFALDEPLDRDTFSQ